MLVYLPNQLDASLIENLSDKSPVISIVQTRNEAIGKESLQHEAKDFLTIPLKTDVVMDTILKVTSK